MFHTSRRLRRFVRLLRRLPRGLSGEILAAAAVVDGLVRRGRFRRARRLGGGPARGPSDPRLATCPRASREPRPVLRRRGAPRRRDPRCGGARRRRGGGAASPGGRGGRDPAGVPSRPAPAVGPPADPGLSGADRRRAHHVDLGPAMAGHDRRRRGRLPAGRGGAGPAARPLPDSRPPAERSARLPHAPMAPSDARRSASTFPGGPMIVRAGWLALRQLTHAPTFPVLSHREGARQVIVIHPALPPPASRPRAGRGPVPARARSRWSSRSCGGFPEQCRYLALPPWPTSGPGDGGALDREKVAT